MSNIRKISGASLAAAAAMFLVAGCSSTYEKSAQSAEVHCAGINACKGQSSCKSANNSCKGQNACKGQGWQPTASAEECTAAGGTVM